LSPGTADTQLPIFVTQEGQQSPVRDLSESGNAEESKGGGGVCRSARCAGVVLCLMHIHVAISGNDEQLSHGRCMVCQCNYNAIIYHKLSADTLSQCNRVTYISYSCVCYC